MAKFKVGDKVRRVSDFHTSHWRSARLDAHATHKIIKITGAGSLILQDAYSDVSLSADYFELVEPKEKQVNRVNPIDFTKELNEQNLKFKVHSIGHAIFIDSLVKTTFGVNLEQAEGIKYYYVHGDSKRRGWDTSVDSNTSYPFVTLDDIYAYLAERNKTKTLEVESCIYKIVISKDSVKVGCQTITKKDALEIAKFIQDNLGE